MSKLLQDIDSRSGADSQLQGNLILRTFGRSTFWLWLDRGALRIGNAVAGLLLIRYLGPSNFGLYATALAYGELLAVCLNFGLNLRAARDIGVEHDRGKSIVAAYFVIALSSFVAELTFLLAALHFRHWEMAALAAGFLLANCEYTAAFCRGVLTADLRAKATLPGSILSGVGMLAVTGVVLLLHLSYLGLLIGLTIRSLAVVALRLYQIRDHWPQAIHYSWANFRKSIRQTWPYYSYNLVAVGYQRAPVALLGIVALRADVGLFSAAMTLAYIYPLWSDAWNEAVLPLLTRLFEYRRFQELLDLSQEILNVLLFVSIPIAVCMSVFAPQICGIFGPRFIGSAIVLRILAYRCIITILDGFLGQAFLTAIGRVRERRNAQARALAVLVVSTLVLGNYWGAVGAAVALFIADVVLFVQNFPASRSVGLAVNWPALWPSAGAGVAMAMTAIYAPLTLWALKVGPGLLVYGVVLLLLGRSQVLRARITVRECIGRSAPVSPAR